MESKEDIMDNKKPSREKVLLPPPEIYFGPFYTGPSIWDPNYDKIMRRFYAAPKKRTGLDEID